MQIRDLPVSLRIAIRGHDTSRRTVLEIRIPLPERIPVWILASHTRNVVVGRSGAMAPLRLDPQFDAVFEVRGTPRELVRKVFDDDLRHIFADRQYRGASIELKNGVLEDALWHVLDWSDGATRARQIVDMHTLLVRRVMSVWHGHLRAERARGGEPAVRAYVDAARSELEQVESQRGRNRALVVGLIVLFVLAVAGWIVFRVLSGVGEAFSAFF